VIFIDIEKKLERTPTMFADNRRLPFRDNVFLQTSAGRCFVKFYYEVSPPLAVYIRHHDILRTATRLTLTPVVYGVKYPKTSALIFLSSILAISLTLGVRRSNRF